jgi:arsenite-transporting ATPase
MGSLPSFLEHPTRSLFFTGKGGMGKTSVASATALALARRGRRVLLVSTDPASNLDEVLGSDLSATPRPVPGAPGLTAANIDPEEAAATYREEVVGPYRGILPADTVAGIEEQLSGACTVEIAAFDAFARLLADPEATSDVDHVVFDTAPTGHTLRLLKLPAAWTGFLQTNATGTSCIGPLAGLQAKQKLYEDSLAALGDPGRTTLVLVSRPEVSALVESERTRAELADAGMTNQALVLNGLFTANGAGDRTADALHTRQREALATISPGLAALPRSEVPLLARSPMGIERLGQVFDRVDPTTGPVALVADADQLTGTGSLASLVDEIAETGRGVIMTMGKGGVGKTTLAAAIAVSLAGRGHRVQLSTTDPAAHVEAAVGGTILGLEVSRIDPEVETAAYAAEVMAAAGPDLDDAGRALLEEDLRSPCTEEIAVFRAFARTVADGQDGFVVLDTAPTGHTLLLLDAAEAYHREIERTQSELPEAVRTLLPRLRDPGYTRVLIVTLPEATPVHEAGRLAADLRRAGIEPHAWIVNQSLAATGTTDTLLAARAVAEAPFIREAIDEAADRTVLVPWLAEPPKGADGLDALVGSGHDRT